MNLIPTYDCNVHYGSRKARYESIEEAWIVAFRCFALYGHKLTPYKCSFKNGYYPLLVYKPNKNPWSWNPMGKKAIFLKRLWKRRKPCKGWHLTSIPSHILTGGK